MDINEISPFLAPAYCTNSLNSIISFGYVDFQAKIFPILYPLLENLTTLITIRKDNHAQHTQTYVQLSRGQVHTLFIPPFLFVFVDFFINRKMRTPILGFSFILR